VGGPFFFATVATSDGDLSALLPQAPRHKFIAASALSVVVQFGVATAVEPAD
jgi:hypothetical protein